MMLHTTFARAKTAGACIESYRKMGKVLGGISKWGSDTPIPLDKVIKVCVLQDAIWAFRCTIEPSENILSEFTCQCLEHSSHVVEAAQSLADKSLAARNAARNARNAARNAGDVARCAAWDAAWDAEHKWQTEMLLGLLK